MAEQDRTPTDDAREVQPFTLWIIWGGLLVSMLIYGAIVPMLDTGAQMDVETFQTYAIVLSLVAASEVPIIWALRRMTFVNRLTRGDFSDEQAVSQAYFTTSVITWALCESIVIYGFILAFFSNDVLYYVPFASVGIIMMIVFRPDLPAQIQTFRAKSTNDADDSSTADTEW